MSRMTGKSLVNLHESGFKSQLAAQYFHESPPKTVRLYRSRGIKDADRRMVDRGKYQIRKYLGIVQNRAHRGVGVTPWQFSYDTLAMSLEEAMSRATRLKVNISTDSLKQNRNFINRMALLPADMLEYLRNKPEKIRNGRPNPQTPSVATTPTQNQPLAFESYLIVTAEDKKRFARDTLGMDLEEAFQLGRTRGWDTTLKYFNKVRSKVRRDSKALRAPERTQPTPASSGSQVVVALNSPEPLDTLRALYKSFGITRLKAWVDKLIHEAGDDLRNWS